MFGMEYHRLRQKISLDDLSSTANVSKPTIGYAQKHPWIITGRIAIQLADALGVTIDELVREYDGDEANHLSKRTGRKSRTANPENCLEHYRQEKNLSVESLAKRLGNSTREAGRKACIRKTPIRKHVVLLANYEGISESVFRDRYK